jgi:hypothetical protein
MRAIDLDGLECDCSPFRDQAPIDLDAVEEAAASAPTDAPQAAMAGEESPALDVRNSTRRSPGFCRRGAGGIGCAELSVAFESDDPFAFPEGVNPVEAEGSGVKRRRRRRHDDRQHSSKRTSKRHDRRELAGHERARSARAHATLSHAMSVTPLSSAALDDAIAAFGREREA